MKVIDDAWKATTENRGNNTDEDLSALVTDGPSDGSLAAIDKFFEEVLRLRKELDGTEFEVKPARVTGILLRAVGKHHSTIKSTYETSKVGVSGWRNGYDGVYADVRELIESAERNAATSERGRDVLSTTVVSAQADQIADLSAQLAELKSALSTTRQYAAQSRPPCPDCGVVM